MKRKAVKMPSAAVFQEVLVSKDARKAQELLRFLRRPCPMVQDEITKACCSCRNTAAGVMSLICSDSQRPLPLQPDFQQVEAILRAHHQDEEVVFHCIFYLENVWPEMTAPLMVALLDHLDFDFTTPSQCWVVPDVSVVHSPCVQVMACLTSAVRKGFGDRRELLRVVMRFADESNKRPANFGVSFLTEMVKGAAEAVTVENPDELLDVLSRIRGSAGRGVPICAMDFLIPVVLTCSLDALKRGFLWILTALGQSSHNCNWGTSCIQLFSNVVSRMSELEDGMFTPSVVDALCRILQFGLPGRTSPVQAEFINKKCAAVAIRVKSHALASRVVATTVFESVAFPILRTFRKLYTETQCAQAGLVVLQALEVLGRSYHVQHPCPTELVYEVRETLERFTDVRNPLHLGIHLAAVTCIQRAPCVNLGLRLCSWMLKRVQGSVRRPWSRLTFAVFQELLQRRKSIWVTDKDMIQWINLFVAKCPSNHIAVALCGPVAWIDDRDFVRIQHILRGVRKALPRKGSKHVVKQGIKACHVFVSMGSRLSPTEAETMKWRVFDTLVPSCAAFPGCIPHCLAILLSLHDSHKVDFVAACMPAMLRTITRTNLKRKFETSLWWLLAMAANTVPVPKLLKNVAYSDPRVMSALHDMLPNSRRVTPDLALVTFCAHVGERVVLSFRDDDVRTYGDMFAGLWPPGVSRLDVYSAIRTGQRELAAFARRRWWLYICVLHL